MVLNKTDLLPHVDFDVPRCIEYARRVNPAIEVLLVSARNGQGLDAWLDWILDKAHQVAHAAAHAAARGHERGHGHGHHHAHPHAATSA